ncbi:MAG: hypothetical protein QOG73_4255 [Acetobacteraceae bacterium]|nr:hypothetical protein [Acetobacteraceae bacterium]
MPAQPRRRRARAAEELAGYEREFADIKSSLRILQLGQGVTVAALAAIIVNLFVHS